MISLLHRRMQTKLVSWRRLRFWPLKNVPRRIHKYRKFMLSSPVKEKVSFTPIHAVEDYKGSQRATC